MPSREWNFDVKTPVTEILYDHKQGTTESTTSMRSLNKHSGYRLWNNTPNFKQLARTGQLPCNFWQVHRQEQIIHGKWSYRRVIFNPGGSLYQDVEYTQNGPANSYVEGTIELDFANSDKESTEGVAVNGVLMKLKDSSVNLSVMAAEMGQTSKLLESTAQKVITAVSNLKKGNWNGAAKALGVPLSNKMQKKYSKKYKAEKAGNAVSQAWLELQYGWLPLLSDVYGSCEILAEKAYGTQKTRVTKTATRSLKQESSFQPEPLLTVKTVATRLYTVKYVVYYSVPNELKHSLTQLGITNPLLVAWEKLPWSFVVDWFLPVGTWLSTIDATYGLQFVGGSVTKSDEYIQLMTHVGSMQYDANGKGYAELKDSSFTFFKVFHVSRAPLGGFPSGRLPSFKNPLSPQHAANLAALLFQAFKK